MTYIVLFIFDPASGTDPEFFSSVGEPSGSKEATYSKIYSIKKQVQRKEGD